MDDTAYTKLYEIILDVIEPRFVQAGIERKAILPVTKLPDALDSFGLLDAIVEIEKRAGVSADLGQMDFAQAMTVGGLAKEIIRINPKA